MNALKGSNKYVEQSCPRDLVICGFQVKYDDANNFANDHGITNIKFKCCNLKKETLLL